MLDASSRGLKAEREYEAFRAAHAALSQPADRHVAESIDELKKIQEVAKAKGGRAGRRRATENEQRTATRREAPHCHRR